MNRQNGAKLLLGWASPMRVLLKICVIGLGATALAVVVALTWLLLLMGSTRCSAARSVLCCVDIPHASTHHDEMGRLALHSDLHRNT